MQQRKWGPNRIGRAVPAERGLARVGEVLGDLLAAYGLSGQRARRELERRWAEVAGVELASRTRVGRKVRGTLEILVDDSVLLHELAAFRRGELEEKMRAATGGRIRSLRFRLA